MKKLLITIAALFTGTAMYAQPSMTITNNTACNANFRIYASDMYNNCGQFYTNIFTLASGGGNVSWASYVANLNDCYAPIHYLQACPPPNHLDVPTGYWEAFDVTIGSNTYTMGLASCMLTTTNNLTCGSSSVSVTVSSSSITLN